MHLKNYTDYSLRVLMYLGVHPGRLVTIAEISNAFGISKNHLMKVVKDLVAKGYVTSTKGKNGGLMLGMAASEIAIGQVIRQMEGSFALVECLGKTNHCCILPACKLKHVLSGATERFFEALDPYKLSDVIDNGDVIARLLQKPAP